MSRCFLAALFLLGCAAAAGPEPAPSTTCQTEADCELVTGTPPSCCSRCRPTALTKPAAAAARKQCAAVEKATPDYFSRCPHLSCPCEKSAARCKAGACVVESGPCS